MRAPLKQTLERALGSRLSDVQPWIGCGALLLAAFSGLDLAFAPGDASLKAHAAAWTVGALAGAWIGALVAVLLLVLRPRSRRVQILAWLALGLSCGAALAEGLAVRANWGGPYNRLAQLCLAGSVVAGLVIAVVGIAVQPRPTAPRGFWGGWRRIDQGAAVLQAVVGATAAIWADRRGLVVEYPLALLALRWTAFALLLIACVQSIGLQRALRRRPALWASLGIAVLAGVGPWLAPSPVAQILAGRPYSALALSTLATLTDLDRDGFARAFGGGDCREFDASINPAMYDIPGNGIDEDCRLGDAALGDTGLGETALRAVVNTPAAAPAGPSPVSVVYITVDTVSAARLGIYGAARPVSPNVDRWARERALVFENAFTSGSSTTVALAANLRGVNARRLRWSRTAKTKSGAFIPLDDPQFAERTAKDRVTRVYRLPVHDTRPTLPALLSGRGLKTLAVSPVHFLQADTNVVGRFDALKVLSEGGSKAPDDVGATHTALKWLSELGPEQRYFLWVHYLGPHTPSTQDPDAPDFGSDVSAQYDHEIATFDLRVAPLLAELSARQDRGEPLVVILSADHGEEVAQHRFHGHVLNDRVMRVPYLVSLPDRRTGRREMPISSLDTFPTVLSLTQTPAPHALDGKDLTPLFKDGASAPPRVVLGDAWVIDMADKVTANIVVATDGQRAFTSNLRTGAAELLHLTAERHGQRDHNLLEQADPGELRTELERYLQARGTDPRRAY